MNDDIDDIQDQDKTDDPVVRQLVRSMTGFEEIAIAKAFRKPFEDLTGMMALRSLIFMTERRSVPAAPGSRQISDRDAYQAAMTLTIAEVEDWIKTLASDAEGN
jgi:hypothetical protein